MTSEEPCSCGNCTDLAVNPFEALRVSYGMLLGEDDFRVLMGNPRGKQMLQAAWLHGTGVVWGYDVRMDGLVTVRVSPGLALDGLGREVAQTATVCLDLRDWLHENDSPPSQDECGTRTLHCCVVAEFDCCPSRPVPTLADPCDVNRKHDDDSRVTETARIVLRPGPCPSRWHPYHRVRVLLGLDRVGDDDHAGEQALQARTYVGEAPADERAQELLRAFRRLAALDNAELRAAAEPGTSDLTMFPVLDKDAAVTLACLEIGVRDADGCTTIEDTRIELACRTALLPTATIQELTCGFAPGVCDGCTDDTNDDAGGPRVLADDVAWFEDGRTICIPVSAELNPGSVRRAIKITSLSGRGWVDEDIDAVRFDPEGPAIVVEMADRPVNGVVRLIVKGTGSTPVYGVYPPVPLAGMSGGPPGTVNDGHDAVLVYANRLIENEETS
jgi:hypothetical protein